MTEDLEYWLDTYDQLIKDIECTMDYFILPDSAWAEKYSTEQKERLPSAGRYYHSKELLSPMKHLIRVLRETPRNEGDQECGK